MENFLKLDVLLGNAQKVVNGMDNSKITSTLVLMLLVFLMRMAFVTWLNKRQHMPATVVNTWRHRANRTIMILIAVMILVIWAPELRALAVTLVAFAMAIVIAFKEVISCFTGSIVRSTAEGARIGGRIIINGIHGDVTSTDLMSTTLMEVSDYGQRTGRTIVLPNSMFLTHATTTETIAGDRHFVLLSVGIPVSRNEDWQAMETILLEVGEKISSPYMKDAKKHFARFNRRYGFNVPNPEPAVLIDWHDPEKVAINLRVAVPVAEQDTKRQEIWREVLIRAPIQMPVPRP